MRIAKGLLTRAEAAILFGMMLVIYSLFQVWARVTPPDQALLAAAALYRSPRAALYLDGFQTHVWLPLTLCSALCSAGLLWKVSSSNRLALAAVQCACALACLVIALTHIAPLPGVLAALCGGALLAFGAIDRYSGSVAAGN